MKKSGACNDRGIVLDRCPRFIGDVCVRCGRRRKVRAVRRAAAAALLLLAMTIPARAAAPETPPEFPRILGVTVLGKAIDLYTTADCIEAGCREANPLQPTVEHRVAFGAATSVLAAVGFYELEKRDTRFRWGKWAYFAIHVAVAASNELQARKARRAAR